MNIYKVIYKRGLGGPITVEAESLDMAKKMAVAEYRRTSGTNEVFNFSPYEHIVEDVVEIVNDEAVYPSAEENVTETAVHVETAVPVETEA